MLDLVLINDKGDPPVVKLTDAKKMYFDMKVKRKANIKKSSSKDMKELKISYKMGLHDYQVLIVVLICIGCMGTHLKYMFFFVLKVRLKSAMKFIQAGHPVKFLIQFKGRERQHGMS